jgi:tetratricopeptide (TPR) repeat protein
VRRWRLVAAVALPAALCAARLHAQQVRSSEVAARGGAPDLLARADSLVGSGHIEDALKELDAHLERDPSDFDARWRAARAAVYLGILATGTEIENRWFHEGADHADRALALRPKDHEALRWALAAKGNLAVQTRVPENAKMGSAVYGLAQQVLATWPDDPEAYYALGKLEYELLKLNRVQRLMARPFQRDELDHLTWEQALAAAQRAVELDPRSALYRINLGQTLWRMGRRAEATAQWQMARELPLRTPVDGDFRDYAGLLLERVAKGIDPS